MKPKDAEKLFEAIKRDTEGLRAIDGVDLVETPDSPKHDLEVVVTGVGFRFFVTSIFGWKCLVDTLSKVTPSIVAPVKRKQP
jgi:hypothetical protein